MNKKNALTKQEIITKREKQMRKWKITWKFRIKKQKKQKKQKSCDVLILTERTSCISIIWSVVSKTLLASAPSSSFNYIINRQRKWKWKWKWKWKRKTGRSQDRQKFYKKEDFNIIKLITQIENKNRINWEWFKYYRIGYSFSVN